MGTNLRRERVLTSNVYEVKLACVKTGVYLLVSERQCWVDLFLMNAAGSQASKSRTVMTLFNV